MNSREILASYALGLADESVLVDMAQEALAEGYDSHSLRILAGLSEGDTEWPELRRYFRRSMDELSWLLPTDEEAARRLFCYWAHCIVNDDISPEMGSKEIWRVYRAADARMPDQPKRTYEGEALGVAELVGLYWSYDVQEAYIEYEGKPITKAEATEILDLKLHDAARRFLAQNCS